MSWCVFSVESRRCIARECCWSGRRKSSVADGVSFLSSRSHANIRPLLCQKVHTEWFENRNSDMTWSRWFILNVLLISCYECIYRLSNGAMKQTAWTYLGSDVWTCWCWFWSRQKRGSWEGFRINVVVWQHCLRGYVYYGKTIVISCLAPITL